MAPLLAGLRGRGVVFNVLDGGRLAVDAPRGVLTDADRAELRAHKADVLELLAREAGRQELAPRVARMWSERLADWIVVCPDALVDVYARAELGTVYTHSEVRALPADTPLDVLKAVHAAKRAGLLLAGVVTPEGKHLAGAFDDDLALDV